MREINIHINIYSIISHITNFIDKVYEALRWFDR